MHDRSVLDFLGPVLDVVSIVFTIAAFAHSTRVRARARSDGDRAAAMRRWGAPFPAWLVLLVASGVVALRVYLPQHMGFRPQDAATAGFYLVGFVTVITCAVRYTSFGSAVLTVVGLQALCGLVYKWSISSFEDPVMVASLTVMGILINLVFVFLIWLLRAVLRSWWLSRAT